MYKLTHSLVCFLLSLTVLLLPGFSFAQVIYGECYDCSGTDVQVKVDNIVLQNMDGFSLLKVHIADIKNTAIYSYTAIDRDGLISLEAAAVPSYLKSQMEEYEDAYDTYSKAAKNLEIPKTVLGSAWEYVNCAYCLNDITDYVSGSLQGKAMQAGEVLTELAEIFGLIKTSIPNQYSLSLAAGGKIVVTLEVDADANLYIELVKVIDDDNNTIPAYADKLKDLVIKVDSDEKLAIINSFINRFGYHAKVPDTPTGSVTITDIP